MIPNVVSCIFINKYRQVLLCLRDNKPEINHPNKWALIGGHIENESIIDALKREVLEEIEYEIKEMTFIGDFEDDVGNIVAVYKSYIDRDVNELHLNEGQKIQFFNFEDAIKLDTPKILKKIFIEYKDKIFS